MFCLKKNNVCLSEHPEVWNTVLMTINQEYCFTKCDLFLEMKMDMAFSIIEKSLSTSVEIQKIKKFTLYSCIVYVDLH